MCIASLLFLTNCRDEEVVRSSEGKRTITVDLGITMSRATDVEGVIGDYSHPDNLQLWIFDDNIAGATRIFYENITEGLQFSMVDLSNRLVQTIERIINVENEINTLHFYIVMNSEGISLGETSTPQDIEEATFTRQTTWTGDNKVPLYGYGTLDVSKHRSEYSVSIAATRAVGKLELFFTKENENSSLAITKVEITQGMPDKGYLAAVPTDDNRTYTAPNPSVVLFESEQEQDGTITQSLPEEEGAFGEFSSHEDRFRSLLVSYLLENPNGVAWDDENQDWTYPETLQGTSACYKVVVSYQLNGRDEQGEMYLSETERNVWNKIFVRVNDKGELQIRYKAMPWEVVESKIGYAPKPIPTDDNPFADYTNDDKWEETSIVKDGYYILLPRGSYNDDSRNTTHGLFSYLYERPDNGDDDARYCILTKPTYVDNDHKILKTGSAGARYMFLLTGPKGATWTAHLSNNEEFYFSNSDVNDFNHSVEYADEGSVNMVSHGIARPKPYIIQINVRHSWTGVAADNVEVDESGNVTGEYPWYLDEVYGAHVDDINDDLDDKESWWNEGDRRDDFWAKYDEAGNSQFEDAFFYYTAWGKDMDEKQDLSLISTDFYITVKLADGTEYELTINPPYSYLDASDKTDTKYKSNRRFAGTDTRIRIRHVPAQYGWSYDDLANDEKNTGGKEWWWKVNSDWK